MPDSEDVDGLPGASCVNLSEPAALPGTLGENVTEISWLPPAAMLNDWFAVAKGPVVVIAETFSVSLPVFEIVTVIGALVVPTRWLPNATDAGIEIAGWMPVPESETSVGLPGASCVNRSVPDAAPVAVGLNVTEMFAEAPAGIVTGLLGVANGPVVVIVEMFSVSEPVFEIVRIFPALVVPTR